MNEESKKYISFKVELLNGVLLLLAAKFGYEKVQDAIEPVRLRSMGGFFFWVDTSYKLKALIQLELNEKEDWSFEPHLSLHSISTNSEVDIEKTIKTLTEIKKAEKTLNKALSNICDELNRHLHKESMEIFIEVLNEIADRK